MNIDDKQQVALAAELAQTVRAAQGYPPAAADMPPVCDLGGILAAERARANQAEQQRDTLLAHLQAIVSLHDTATTAEWQQQISFLVADARRVLKTTPSPSPSIQQAAPQLWYACKLLQAWSVNQEAQKIVYSGHLQRAIAAACSAIATVETEVQP